MTKHSTAQWHMILSIFHILTYNLISSVRCLFKSFAHFWTGLFIFSLLDFKNSFFILDLSLRQHICQIRLLQIFSPILWFVFSFSGHIVGVFTSLNWQTWQIRAFPQRASCQTCNSALKHSCCWVNCLPSKMFRAVGEAGWCSEVLSVGTETEQRCYRT